MGSKRDRRGSADGASGSVAQPRVDAAEMEHVSTLRQQPKNVGVGVLSQTYGTARTVLVVSVELGLRVEDLREAAEDGVVESAGATIRRRSLAGDGYLDERGWGLAGGSGTGAEVGEEG